VLCQFDSTGCAVCGDNQINTSKEACDGIDLAGETCESQGFGGGVLLCSLSCALDIGGCYSCGDGTQNPGEICDGNALGGASCTSQGYDGGVLACTTDCQLDVGSCHKCGDTLKNGSEECDGADLGGQTCQGLGFDGGALGCTATCTYELLGCQSAACGDGVKNGNDQCDGTDLGGESCQGLGFDGGVLACSQSCGFDTAGCYKCGDLIKNGAEQCDGSDLGLSVCPDLGYDGGDLGCSAGCTFDTAGCYTCGDAQKNGAEACDGADLDSQTCALQGFDGGTLACATDCTFDTAGCTVCGDGLIEGNEVCDTDELNEQDCEGLGYDTGTLTCAENCNSYDETLCTWPDGHDCQSDSECTNDICKDGICCLIGDCCQSTCNSSGQCPDPVVCVSSDQCHDAGVCDPTTGTCSDPAKSEGTSCDDGDTCTQNDACNATGICGGQSYECNDDLNCTIDNCDGAGGCDYDLKEGLCLIDGVCYAKDQLNPSLGDSIHRKCEICDPAANTSGWTYTQQSCDDEDLCTYEDVCSFGLCEGKSVTCADDPSACGIKRACSGTATCTESFPGPETACDDAKACTHSDACNSQGSCIGQDYTCDDDLDCTQDTCIGDLDQGIKGCEHDLKAGHCLMQDIFCYKVGDLNPALTDTIDAPCQVCDPGENTIQWSPTTSGCDDVNPCTLQDKCSAGSCGGSPKPCEDNLECTDNKCNEITGDCYYPISEGWCYINEECKADEAINLDNTCEECVADGTHQGTCVRYPFVIGSGRTSWTAPCQGRAIGARHSNNAIAAGSCYGTFGPSMSHRRVFMMRSESSGECTLLYDNNSVYEDLQPTHKLVIGPDGNSIYWAHARGHGVGTICDDVTCHENSVLYRKTTYSGSYVWSASDYHIPILVQSLAVASDGSSYLAVDKSGSHIRKYDAAGLFVWEKAYSAQISISAIGVGLNDSPFWVGGFAGTQDLDPSTKEDIFSSVSNSTDVVISHLTNLGEYEWSWSFGGSGEEIAHDMVVKDEDTILIGGEFTGPADFDPTTGEDPADAEYSTGFLWQMGYQVQQ